MSARAWHYLEAERLAADAVKLIVAARQAEGSEASRLKRPVDPARARREAELTMQAAVVHATLATCGPSIDHEVNRYRAENPPMPPPPPPRPVVDDDGRPKPGPHLVRTGGTCAVHGYVPGALPGDRCRLGGPGAHGELSEGPGS